MLLKQPITTRGQRTRLLHQGPGCGWLRGGVLGTAMMLATVPALGRYNDQGAAMDGNDSPAYMPYTEELSKVGVAQRLNDTLPLDLSFVNDAGQTVTLGDYFQADRPVILNLGYYRCPQICGLVMKALTDKISDTDLALGDDFIVLNITIDANETPEQAAGVKAQAMTWLAEEGRDDQAGNAAGWQFLTAGQDAIDAITQAVGYNYVYIATQNEFAHPATLVVASGQSTIARYIHGTAYDARTLRLSLVETSEGKIGNLLDAAFLQCFAFDPEANNYAATARTLMTAGGAVTLCVVAGGVGAFFMYERRRNQLTNEPTRSQ